MDFAYDNVQHKIIYAEEVKRDAGFRLRRYDFVCPYCSKEVQFIHTRSQRPHFRHAYGTYAVDCEQYACSYVASDKNETFKERNIGVKLEWHRKEIKFYLTAKFDFDEIQKYEAGNVSLKYWIVDENGRRDTINEYSISESVFVPDDMKMLPLTNNKQVFYEYGDKNGKYNLWGSCVIYKVCKISLENDEIEAKLLTSKNLYVGQYYIILSSQKLVDDLHVRGISMWDVNTINDAINAYLISIDEYSLDSQKIFDFYDYYISEKSGGVTVLWPPLNSTDDKFNINTDYIYLKSKDILQAYQNINGIADNIGQNIYRIKLVDKLKILVDDDLVVYGKSSIDHVVNQLEIRKQEVKIGNVMIKESGWFLTNPISPTLAMFLSNVRLKDGDELHRYMANYLVEQIIATKEIIEQGTGLLIVEILKLNKSQIEFEDRDLDYEGNDPAVIRYLERCMKTGKINPIIREMLRSGKIW